LPRNIPDFTMNIFKEGDKRLIQFQGAGPKMELSAISENEFTAKKYRT